jgi:hypothetical protein
MENCPRDLNSDFSDVGFQVQNSSRTVLLFLPVPSHISEPGINVLKSLTSLKSTEVSPILVDIIKVIYQHFTQK